MQKAEKHRAAPLEASLLPGTNATEIDLDGQSLANLAVPASADGRMT